jgi:diguanylate cyclase (GGDEF)-like protein
MFRVPGEDESKLDFAADRRSGNRWQGAWIGVFPSVASGDRLKLRFHIFVLIVGLALAQAALASDLIVSRTLLQDPKGALTIAGVAGRVDTPAEPTLLLAGSDSVYWLCLRVRAPGDGGKVVLSIRPALLNEVRLYEAGSGDPLTWKTRVAGATGDFVIDVPAPQATYYLRFKNDAPVQSSVEALDQAEAGHMNQQRDLAMMFFVAVMLCMLFWAILNYLLDRQPELGLFAIYLAVYTLFAIGAAGYLAPLFPAHFPQMAHWINAVLYLAINFTAVLFCRELFKAYEPHPLFMRAFNLLLGASPVLLAAIALRHSSFAINANAALIQITWLYFAIVAFAFRVEETPRRWIMRAFFVAVCASNAAFWMAGRSSSILPSFNLVLLQLLVVNGLVTGGLFALTLKARARQAQRRAHESLLDLLRVQKKFEIEKELKKQAEVQAQTDYLTGVFNRRYFVESAEREIQRAYRFQRPLSLIMIDIDHFKAINDTWGHSFGDVVLQQVSHMIRDALRTVDIFGRTGGEEFATVLVETEGGDAFGVAQRLCAVVADAVIVPPGAKRIQVTVSIGLSQLKGRNISFQSLLDEADRAMYIAKESGRNRVSVSEEGWSGKQSLEKSA